MSGPRPLLIDFYCGAGGCSVGYDRAGFDVVGVDIEPHPDYPFPFHREDALATLSSLLEGFSIPFVWTGATSGVRDVCLADAQVIHGSPPCPRYSVATPAAARESHPDHVPPFRDLARAWGGTYVIENVPGAPLDHPVMLCGSAFGLRVRRHRLFESNAFLMSPGCYHDGRPAVGVYGAHADREGGWLRPDGTSRGVKATSVADAQDAMGIDWMTRWEDLADAIPPAMTEHIGGQLIDQLGAVAA